MKTICALAIFIGLTAVAAFLWGSLATAGAISLPTSLPAQHKRASAGEMIAMGMGGDPMGGGQSNPMGSGMGSGQMGQMGGMNSGPMGAGQMGPMGGGMGNGQMGPTGQTGNAGMTGGAKSRQHGQGGNRRRGNASGAVGAP